MAGRIGRIVVVAAAGMRLGFVAEEEESRSIAGGRTRGGRRSCKRSRSR